MTEISTAKKMGIVARVAAHEAQRHAQSSRLLRATFAGGRAVLASALRAAHILWLQIAGVFFVFFGLAGGIAFWKEYRAWEAHRVGPQRAALALCFGLMFTWFGVTSFVRARRK